MEFEKVNKIFNLLRYWNFLWIENGVSDWCKSSFAWLAFVSLNSSWLLPYLMNLLDPQKGQDLSETEFRRSISKLERTGCFASYHFTIVFSISSCSLVLVALLDHENDRNRWCGFLFRFDILAVHWFRRWITWTAKFIKSYSSLKSIWCFLWSNKIIYWIY